MMSSSQKSALHPTLWRTCRVLANRTRLRMLKELLVKPDQTVSEMAETLGISVPVSSQYLRALNARGLLKVRRAGRYVLYRPGANESIPETRLILKAVQHTFDNEMAPIDTIFRLATAFTHPRREEIFRALGRKKVGLAELKSSTGISFPALRRHLQKLENRGFVLSKDDVCWRNSVKGRFARTLLRELLAGSD